MPGSALGGRLADTGRGPQVLSVGDLHVENFGTWRNAEGRMVWGINDFDEAYPMAYTNDLVRLAASACLAIRQDALKLDPDDACHAIRGLRRGMEKGGLPGCSPSSITGCARRQFIASKIPTSSGTR